LLLIIKPEKIPIVYTPALAATRVTHKKPAHVRLLSSPKYQKSISGHILDRIDIHIKAPRVDFENLGGDRLGCY
jgi:predicted ATPase with chaperone activity